MERSLHMLLVVISFGICIQGGKTILPSTTWCDLKCLTKIGGCIGFEGTCQGVCYCLGVSFTILHVSSVVLNKRI